MRDFPLPSKQCRLPKFDVLNSMSYTLCDTNGDFLARWIKNLGLGLPGVTTFNLFTVVESLENVFGT